MNILISWNTVTALWLIFCLYWAISALRVKRARHTEPASLRFATMAVLGCGAFLVFSRTVNFGILNRRFIPDDLRIKAIAVVLVAVGVAFSIWAVFGTTSMPSEPRRTTLSPGKLPGV